MRALIFSATKIISKNENVRAISVERSSERVHGTRTSWRWERYDGRKEGIHEQSEVVVPDIYIRMARLGKQNPFLLPQVSEIRESHESLFYYAHIYRERVDFSVLGSRRGYIQEAR